MKIGILTHYYGSYNYGGVLQAYALVKVLRKMGYDAEQICFPYFDWRILDNSCVKTTEDTNESLVNPPITSKKRCLPIRFLARIKRGIYSRTIGRSRTTHINQVFLSPRVKAFDLFRDSIPHSKLEYTLNTLFLANDEYDTFITGSDQVWNLQWQHHGFFLEFVDDDKKKIAYAASAGASAFDEVQQKYLKRVLPKFDAISVREKDLVETYKEIAGVNAEFVLDPTLLLDKEDWDEIASPRLVNEKYLFCFFYNPTEKYYELARQYAEKHNLKIATVSYALFDSNIRLEDDFGDYQIGAASPEDFISLIKHASCVFTDSFHCNVFSIIYHRPFFTFGRDGSSRMNSRIVSLTDMFCCSERFCDIDSKQTIDYLDSVPNREYSFGFIQDMKKSSIDYLKRSIKE